MKKTLEIILDNGVLHTRYATLNTPGVDAHFFEGTEINGKRLTPLSEAKKWAKDHGYTQLEIVSLKLKKSNKIYII